MVYGECNLQLCLAVDPYKKENVQYNFFVENLGTLLIVKKHLPI
jgi:hypothetical protein